MNENAASESIHGPIGANAAKFGKACKHTVALSGLNANVNENAASESIHGHRLVPMPMPMRQNLEKHVNILWRFHRSECE